jgi:predicted TIM-barrel fold metal-dependent hydrolase
VDGALHEIEYSLDTLKADGICMMTDYEGKYLGDPKFTPVMEELNRRKAVLYFHPFRAECCKNLQPELGPATIELGTDTTRNIASLIFSGTTARFPDIRLIFSHGGGTFPYLMNRMATIAERPAMKANLPNGLLYEVQKLYYDTAMFFNPYSNETFRKLVPTSHILYGTDYPFVTPETVANGLADCGYSASELRAIERENALALFPRLKKT